MEGSNIKRMVAAVLVVTGHIYNSVGVMCVILMFAMVLDYVTGMAAAYITGGVNSKDGLNGILRKLCYFGLVVTAFLFDLCLIYTAGELGVILPFDSIFGLITTGWLFSNEAVSILENLGAAGLPIPGFLKKGLKLYKDRLEQMKEANHDGGNV